jgi:hypothetical protein
MSEITISFHETPGYIALVTAQYPIRVGGLRRKTKILLQSDGPPQISPCRLGNTYIPSSVSQAPSE